MEIPSLIYFSCLSLISIISLNLGFISLDRENSQISPLTIFFLKRFLAVCICHSSTYALTHRSNFNYTKHLKLSLLGFPFLFYIYISSGPIPFTLVLTYSFVVTLIFSLFTGAADTALSVDFIVRSITFSLKVQHDAVFPLFVLVVAFFTAAIFDRISSDRELFSNWGNRLISKKRRIVEFTASVLASVAFQMAVRFDSLSHALAFLWFAVAWLGCTGLTMARFELGFFDLLVYNVLIGCTNRFGLSGPTGIAFCGFVVLFVLQSKLKTVCVAHDRDVVVW